LTQRLQMGLLQEARLHRARELLPSATSTQYSWDQEIAVGAEALAEAQHTKPRAPRRALGCCPWHAACRVRG